MPDIPDDAGEVTSRRRRRRTQAIVTVKRYAFHANAIIKGFSNSDPNLRKCSFNIQLYGEWHQNVLSS